VVSRSYGQRIADEFAAREIEMNVVHVRTKDSFARLDAKEIALLCGGVPAAGVIITDLLRRWYGTDFRSRMSIVASIDEIYFGLALMRSKMAYGCMLTSVSIATAAVEGRLPGGPGRRLVEPGGASAR
jgi:hypothetical protein